VAFAGNGVYAIDNALGLTFLTDATQVWYAIAAAAIVAVLNLAVRRRPAS
jgi:hypothetical protein